MPPPDAPGFEPRAIAWLLDQAPADFRAHEVFRKYPRALAWAVECHLRHALEAAREMFSTARREFSDTADAEATDEVLTAVEFEGVRLRRTMREVSLVRDALEGGRWVARL